MRLPVLAWIRLARVFQKVDRASTLHLQTWNLNVPQFDVLTQVGASEGITQQELANKLLVTKGNISQLVDRLEHDGLLHRSREGRVNILSLTQAGRHLYNEVVPVQEALIAQQFSPLSSQEQEQLLRLLRTLDHTLPI